MNSKLQTFFISLLLLVNFAIGGTVQAATGGMNIGTKPATDMPVEAQLQKLADSFGVVARDGKLNESFSQFLMEGIQSSRYQDMDVQGALDSMSYLTSRELRLSIPKTSYVLVAHWGFVGSGDQDLEVLMPLQAIKVTLEQDSKNTPVYGQGDLFQDLGKALFENEVSKMVGRNGDLEILKSLGISDVIKPRMVFLMKLVLLINHTIKTQNIKFFYEEFVRLGIRLSLSNDISLTHASAIEDFMPRGFIESIDNKIPGLSLALDAILGLVKKVIKPKTSASRTTPIKTCVYVFKKGNKAVPAFMSLVKQQAVPNNLYGSMVAWSSDYLEHQQGLAIIDIETFKAQLDLEKDGMGTRLSDFSVGHEVVDQDYESDLVEDGVLSQAQVDQLTNAHELPYIASFNQGDCTVVCCKTDYMPLDLADTVMALGSLMEGTWADYLATVQQGIKEQTKNASNDELLLSDVAERKRLQEFMASADGKEARRRVEADVFATISAAQTPYGRALMLHEIIAQRLADLKTDKATVTAKIAALEPVVSGPHGSDVAMMSAVKRDLARTKKSLETVDAEIEIAESDLEKAAVTLEAFPIHKKKTELDGLVTMINAQRTQGNAITTDVATYADVLKADLKNALQVNEDARQQEWNASMKERLELRLQICEIYENEREIARENLAATRAQAIKTPISLGREASFELYIKYLDARIQKMQAQQTMLNTLMLYRETLAQGMHLTAEKIQEMYSLEREVGFVLNVKNPFDACRVTYSPTVFQRFVNDVLMGSPTGNAFAPVREKFMTGIADILNHSSYARENMILVRFMIARFIPSLQCELFQKLDATKNDHLVSSGYANTQVRG